MYAPAAMVRLPSHEWFQALGDARRRTPALARLATAIGLGIGMTACAPQIGDSCKTPLDCDAGGRRACDVTQPGGYCLVANCERGSCPEEAVCVRFRPEPARLASTVCMATCSDDGYCRADEDYRCVSADSLNARACLTGGERLSEIEGAPASGTRFCAWLPPQESGLGGTGGADGSAQPCAAGAGTDASAAK